MGTLVLRVPEVLMDYLVLLVKLDGGVVLVLMEPEECQESLELRVTVALMAFLVCLETRVIGVKLEEWDPQDPLERTERGEMMETSDPEVFPANRGPVVCSGLKGLLDFLVLLVSAEMMVHMVQKETWDPKESLVLQDSRGLQEHRERQGHRVPMDRQERKVPQESQVCQECPELTVLPVIPERKALVEPKEIRVLMVLRGLLAILALGESRDLKVSVD